MRPMTLKPRTTPSGWVIQVIQQVRQRLKRREASDELKGELTAEVVVRLVLRPVDVRRGESTQVTDSDLECGCERGRARG